MPLHVTIAWIAGFVGVVLTIIATLAGAISYSARRDKPFGRNYSPFTHMVSQLGHSSTPQHTLFNVLMILSAACFAALSFGVAREVDDKVIKAILTTVAIPSGIAGALVGLIPSGKPREGSPAHLIFAIFFFMLSAFIVGVFSGYALFADLPNFPRELGWVGAAAVLDGAAMLIVGLVMLITGNSDWSVPDLLDNRPPVTDPPHFMIMPTLEWGYILLLNVWVVVMSIHLLLR
jgi:hypothetical membrane protein